VGLASVYVNVVMVTPLWSDVIVKPNDPPIAGLSIAAREKLDSLRRWRVD